MSGSKIGKVTQMASPIGFTGGSKVDRLGNAFLFGDASALAQHNSAGGGQPSPLGGAPRGQMAPYSVYQPPQQNMFQAPMGGMNPYQALFLRQLMSPRRGLL